MAIVQELDEDVEEAGVVEEAEEEDEGEAEEV